MQNEARPSCVIFLCLVSPFARWWEHLRTHRRTGAHTWTVTHSRSGRAHTCKETHTLIFDSSVCGPHRLYNLLKSAIILKRSSCFFQLGSSHLEEKTDKNCKMILKLLSKSQTKWLHTKNSRHSEVYNQVFALTKTEVQEHKHTCPTAGNSRPQTQTYNTCTVWEKKKSLTWSGHSCNPSSFLLPLVFLFSLSCTLMHMQREWIRYPSLGHPLMWLSSTETSRPPLPPPRHRGRKRGRNDQLNVNHT